MKWRRFVTDYLSFSKKDRIGLLAVIGFIIIICLLPLLWPKKNTISVNENQMLLMAVDTITQKQAHQDKNYYNEEEELNSQYEPLVKNTHLKGELFQFDPNSLLEDGWKKLGLKERTIETIEKYRNKGGRFYKAEDLQKIWGLPKGFYERVKKYIVIAETKFPRQENNSVSKKSETTWNIDINNADTSALIELPGIGSKLASRIVSFREKLGGFYSIDQVKETYGLPDSTFQKIKPYLHATNEVKKLNVNAATKDELKVHPYIKWNIANAIVEYRNQHGNYNNIEELKNISLIDETTFTRLSHYLSL